MQKCCSVCRRSRLRDGLLGGTAGLWRWARGLSTSQRRWRRLEEEEHEVKERLERNILRAGLRLLRGDRAALEENVRRRAVSVDLEKLVTKHLSPDYRLYWC